jgi:hypothetical protein
VSQHGDDGRASFTVIDASTTTQKRKNLKIFWLRKKKKANEINN